MKIIPQTPLVGQHLLARGTGGTKFDRFAWEINGEQVAGETGAGLDAGFLSKGDEVAVTAFSEGRAVQTSVVIGNTPPKILSVHMTDPAIHHGVDIELQPVGDDADGDPVDFRIRWIHNEVPKLFYDDQLVLPGNEFERGDRIVFTVVPFDGEEEGEPYVVDEFTIPNAPPQFVFVPEGKFDGTEYVCQVVAEDADGDEVVYVLEEGPAGMTIDSQTGQISWKVGEVPAEPARIRVAADDGFGGVTVQEFSLSFVAEQEK